MARDEMSGVPTCKVHFALKGSMGPVCGSRRLNHATGLVGRKDMVTCEWFLAEIAKMEKHLAAKRARLAR